MCASFGVPRCWLHCHSSPAAAAPAVIRSLQAISRHIGNKTLAATRLYWSRHRVRLGLDEVRRPAWLLASPPPGMLLDSVPAWMCCCFVGLDQSQPWPCTKHTHAEHAALCLHALPCPLRC